MWIISETFKSTSFPWLYVISDTALNREGRFPLMLGESELKLNVNEIHIFITQKIPQVQETFLE